jgi:hypothetical protein
VIGAAVANSEIKPIAGTGQQGGIWKNENINSNNQTGPIQSGKASDFFGQSALSFRFWGGIAACKYGV